MAPVIPLHADKTPRIQTAPVTDAVRLDHVHLHFDHRCVLHDVTVTIPKGALWGIMGANGAGKTTLLRAIVGLIQPSSGKIHMDTRQRSRIGYLPQISEFDRDFPIRVRELVAMGLLGQKKTRSEQKSIIASCLAMTDMQDYAETMIGDLSVGQLKRVLFSRLLAQDVDILCLDEPFAEVDENTARDLMVVLQKMQGQGKTILVALHHSELARTHFEQILWLNHQSALLGHSSEILPQIESNNRMGQDGIR